MFKIYLSRTVSPGVGISLPATIEEMREAYSLLNGTDTVPLETATAYVESSIPNLRQYLYEVPVSEKRLEELNYLAYRVKWMDSQDEAVFGTVIEMMKPETLQDMINLSCNMDKFRYLPGVTTEVKLGEHLLKGKAYSFKVWTYKGNPYDCFTLSFRQQKVKWMRSRALWEFQTGANVNS